MDADTEQPQRSAEPLWLWCSPDDIANLERLGSIRLYRDLYAQSGDVAFVVMPPGAYDEMNRQPSPREVALEKALRDVRQELWVDYCLRMGRTDTDPRPFNSKPHIRIIDDALSQASDGEDHGR